MTIQKGAYLVLALLLLGALASCRQSSPPKDVLFLSNRDGDMEIYVMRADGSRQTQLTNNDAQDVEAVWSPDGSHVAFTSNRDGNNEIYVMNADGKEQTRLTNHSALDSSPQWSPDSSHDTAPVPIRNFPHTGTLLGQCERGIT